MSAESTPNLAPGLERAFATPPQEMDLDVAVEGEIPSYLRGTHLSNGPARFVRGDFRYRHWLDGDGMVSALRFDDSGVHFSNRWVTTTKRHEEEAAGRAIYRAFGTAFAGDQMIRGLALASPANVSVFPWQGFLLASGEQGLPIALDPATLVSQGEYTFGGRLNPLSPLAAHPKLDPHTGELLHFGASFAGAQPSITYYRFLADGTMALRRRIEIDRAAVLHDFAVSERHVMFHLGPYVVDVEPLLRGGVALQDCLRWKPELPTLLLVLDRETGDQVARIPLPFGYCLHLANAWEENDRLHVELLELDGPAYDEYHPLPDLFPTVKPGRPVRYQIDLAAGKLMERLAAPYENAPDFPNVDPRRFARRAHDVWMLGIAEMGKSGTKSFDEVVHIDWERNHADTWRAPRGVYPAAEPVMVPDPSEERGGTLIVPLYDSHDDTTTYALFDALDVARGPRARLPLGRKLHLAFHATWVDR